MANTHKEALEHFNLAANRDRGQRDLALDDGTFVHAEDGQWEQDAIAKRRNRPRYTINRITGAIDQIIGDQRQNRVSVKVSPRREGDEATARVFTGLIRNIEQESDAISAYDQAFDEQITGGFGGWRILTRFEDDSFDQEIVIEHIDSAASSLFFDPSAEKHNRSDAEYAFYVEYFSTEEYKSRWPEFPISDLSPPVDSNLNRGRSWFYEDTVRVAEYWYKEPVRREIGLLSDGRIIDIEEEKAVLDELADSGVTLLRTRTVDSHKVKSRYMSGSDFLTEPKDWAGKYIPLIPVFGKTAVVNGKRYIRGIVRAAKDPQRIYNYTTSAAVEATALTPKDPIWLTPTQAKGHEKSLKGYNTSNSPFMFYNHDPANPGMPKRGGAPQLQQALIQQNQQAANDIFATTGMEPARMGNLPQLKSGEAIKAQGRLEDRGAFIYRDNLVKAISYTGMQLVDLIPKIYDTERTVQILGQDGNTESVSLNETIKDLESGEDVIVNDLAKGKYSVTVQTGPSFATKREETANQLVLLAGQSPVFQELAMDLIVKNLDLNNGEEMEKRIRKQMITKGLIEATPEERKELKLDEPKEPNPTDVAIVKNLDAQTEKLQIEGQKVIADVANKDASTQKVIMDTQKVSVDALVAVRKMILEKLEAGLPITEEEITILKGQSALVEETQGDVISGGEVAGSTPLGR